MLKIKVLIILSFIVSLSFAQNDSKNITEIFNWTSTDTNTTLYNDCWGYEDSLGREYAVIGSNWGTHFFEVTDTLSEIKLIAEFEGKVNKVVWRDFKTHDHYLYGVADGDTNSLQIFDLQYLPDSVVKVYDNDSISKSAHNIFIENGRLYFCSNRVNNTSIALDIYSIQNPVQPELLMSMHDSFFGGSVLHDINVKNNIAYCSAGNNGLYIYDLNDLNNPGFITLLNTYPDQGYNHSSWVSDDETKLVVADEVPSTLALKLFDITDKYNIELLDIFHSNDLATPHNPFFVDDKIVVSYYLDGVQIFDYSSPLSVKRVAFFDTYPDDTSYFNISAYKGCWGVYPFLSSRNVIASDRKYGLFVLDVDQDALLNAIPNKEGAQISKLKTYPNPIKNNEILTIQAQKPIRKYWVYNSAGELISHANTEGSNTKLQLKANFNTDFVIVVIQHNDNSYYKSKINLIK